MSYPFAHCTPEEVGIPSRVILDFLSYLDRRGIEMHSFMILRHGKVCSEGWWAPYSADITHPVFSFGKSMTSTAIGFAEQEGLLSIDEKLVDIFREELPENPSENLKKVTLRHLLSMSCGHAIEPNAHSDDWIRLFLAHPFEYEPGTMFQYNNTGTNMLVAALKRKTGQNLTHFLRSRLFDPLGIDNVTCAVRPDGIEQGAFGFKLTTDGMARFAQFVLQRGVWNGERLLDENWFDRATIKQVETVGGVYDGKKDWGAGYCFQYWRFAGDDVAFRADGACGQFGMILPIQDAVVITTAGTALTQQLVDGVWDILVPAMSENPLPENMEEARALREKTNRLKIAPLFAGRVSDAEMNISGRIFRAEQEVPGIHSMFGGFGLYRGLVENISSVSFQFSESTLAFKCMQNGTEKTLSIGLEGSYATCLVDDTTYAGVGRWRSPHAFEAEIRSLSSVSGNRLLFRFEGDKFSLTIDPTLVMNGGPGSAKTPVFSFMAE